MGRILFVTGTGTDVGKTSLSLAVLLWARARGLRAAYLKPVQCGTYAFGDPPREGGDADRVRASAGDPAVHVTYTLRMAASPHLAAERENVVLDPERLRGAVRSIAGETDLLVCEGAGGAAVPLDRDGRTLADLARESGAEPLIAAAPGLGTLHHTLATAAWLRGNGLPPAGFAFCRRSPEAEPLEEDNQRTLARLLGIPFFGAVPFSPGFAAGRTLSPPEAEALWRPVGAALEAWLSRPAPDGGSRGNS